MIDTNPKPKHTNCSAEELLAYSQALESEAVDRFNDIADQKEMHHNY